MKKNLFIFTLLVVMSVLPVSGLAFSARVISDTELDTIHGQTGIFFNTFLTDLVGEDYSSLTAEEIAVVHQEIRKVLGSLTEDEIDRIIDTHQMMAEKIARLPAKQQEQLNTARRLLSEELQTTSEEELLKMINSPGVTADNLAMFARDRLNQILIAQQIIAGMIQTLSSHEQSQISTVQQIIDGHFNTLHQQ